MQLPNHTKSKLTWINKENLIIIITGITCGFFVYYPISDFDIFWHLAAGKEIITKGSLLFTDPFSYTNPGQKWFDLHCFFQIMVYQIHNLFSLNTLLLFKAILIGTSISILYKSAAQGRSILLTSFSIMITVYAFRYLITMRPIIFTIFFISLYYYLLDNFFKHRKKIYLFFLIPVQIAWVNSQGLFLTGLFIYLAYFSGELTNNYLANRFPQSFRYNPHLKKNELITISIFFLLLLFSSFINPYAQDAVTFAFRLLKNITPSPDNLYSTKVTENMSIFKMLDTDYTYYIYALAAMIAVLSISSIFSLHHIRFTYLFSSIIFLALGYMAQRNLILFGLAIIPHFCWNMQHLSFSFPKHKKFLKIFITAALFILTINRILTHYQFLKNNPYTIAPFSFPEHSTEYLRKADIPGNIFNADRHGGYLIWHLYPEKKVFIDTRLTLRSSDFFAEYLTVLYHPEDFFSTLCKAHNITQVIVPLCGTDLYFNLTRYLYGNSDWNLVSTDGSEALFVLDSLSNGHNIRLDDSVDVHSIYHSLKKRFARESRLVDESVFNFGNLLVQTNNLLSAESILAKENSDECRLLYSRVMLLKGENENALTILQDMIKADPGNIRAQALAASVYVSLHRYSQAKKAVFSIFIRDPLKVFNVLREITGEKKI